MLNMVSSINDSSFPAVFLCYDTGFHKDGIGNMFVYLSKLLDKKRIASILSDLVVHSDSLAH